MMDFSVGHATINAMEVAGASLLIALISYIVAIAVVILINVLISLMFKHVAVMKGHREIRYFWMPFFFGIVGYILVAALPDRGVQPHAVVHNIQNTTDVN